MKIRFYLLLFVLMSQTAMISSCGDNQESKADLSEKDKAEKSYEMMHSVFEGNPEIEEFKPLIDEVLTKYGYEITEENLNSVGSALLELKKASKVGVTEMEILKHIYQKGSTEITFAEQAGLSAASLESTK